MMNMLLLRRRLLLSGAALALPAWNAWAAPELAPRPLVFPRDHGSHNGARTEWWYLTGAIGPASGATHGFQITFFRSRVDAAQNLPGRLAAKHLVFAHAAITDVQGQRLWHDQRIGRWNGELPPEGPERSGPGAVFADQRDTHIALRGWSLQRLADGRYRVRVQSPEIALSIDATPTQAPLLQGTQGFSRKGPDTENSSFYVSHPQLAVSGSLGLGGTTRQVDSGRAWLAHEWSESLLHREAVGWDWIGMNLFNGDSLTAFRLRRADGSTLWAGGSWRSAARGNDPLGATVFAPDAVHFEPLRHWRSDATQTRYPVAWRITSPAGVHTVQALIDNQELDSRQSTGTVYWEGLSDLLDAQGQRVGRGYLEMTGYAQRLVL